MTLARAEGLEAHRRSVAIRLAPRRRRREGARCSSPPSSTPTPSPGSPPSRLDEASIRRGNPNIEHEREVAIFDILESNRFELEGRDDGPYTLDLSIVEDRLVFAVGAGGRAATPSPVVLSLTPLRRIMKDYFIVCETYYQAIRTAPPSRIQSIDMGRRALHDEGSRVLSRAAQGQDHASTATPRGGCSRSSARCTGRDEGWRARGATTCRGRCSSPAP